MLWPVIRTVTVTSTMRRRLHVLRLRCPGRFDDPRCICFGVKGNLPRQRSTYLLQRASARLESILCILSDQPERDQQSNLPDTCR